VTPVRPTGLPAAEPVEAIGLRAVEATLEAAAEAEAGVLSVEVHGESAGPALAQPAAAAPPASEAAEAVAAEAVAVAVAGADKR